MIEVVAAVIEFKGKLLAFRRGPAKYDYVANKFEFPGGKVEENEDQRSALSRELKEELHLNAHVQNFIETVVHIYPDFTIKMHCFLVHLNEFDGVLTEHTEYVQISLADADELDWIEADRPVLTTLRNGYSHVFAD